MRFYEASSGSALLKVASCDFVIKVGIDHISLWNMCFESCFSSGELPLGSASPAALVSKPMLVYACAQCLFRGVGPKATNDQWTAEAPCAAYHNATDETQEELRLFFRA